MKYCYQITTTPTDESRPARGAWVEMSVDDALVLPTPSRAPQGARGLKCRVGGCLDTFAGVAPRKGRVG